MKNFMFCVGLDCWRLLLEPECPL
jgi:hypothetical protein